jgi:M6 family metalloprotease-like protein
VLKFYFHIKHIKIINTFPKMKKLQLFFLMALLLINAQLLHAIPAIPYPITFTQPNGEELTVLVKGDERIHWHESLDGYTLLYNQDGYLTYAILDETGNLQPSYFIATDIEKRDIVAHSFLQTINKNLFYSDMQKQIMLKVWEIEDEYESRGEKGITGLYKALCAFVQFPEKAMTIPMSTFDPLFNQLGYTGNGTGSVRDFFKETSYDQFELEITLCGVYTAPQSEAYYAGSGGTQNAPTLARWTAQQVAAEPSINFADYDNNGNGKVDGFHFIFAGRGQEAGGGSGTIWSHKSSFFPAVTKNGKSISVYSCSPELLYGSITTIGVICHEMTHAILSSPDFYDTNYEQQGQYDGTGMWDLMADGSWNGSPGGNRPAHHNMYIKAQVCGWVTPINLNAPTTVTNMPNSVENPVAYRINVYTNNEHYLLENRQKIKFDTNIPGEGLIIYHVSNNVGTSNINTTHPQKMYPVCASSTVAIPVAGKSNYGTINSAGCPFPGSSNNTAFDGTSIPRMFRWTNTVVSDKPITDIEHNTVNRTISFNFMGGNSDCSPVNNLEVNYDADCESAQVTWNAPTGGSGDYEYNVYRDGVKIAETITVSTYNDVDFTATQPHTWSVEVVCSSDEMSIWKSVTKGACDNYVPVSNITGVPATATATLPLTLTGTVVPNTATNQTIVWSVVDAGITGATLSGSNILNTTNSGMVDLLATITNGASPTTHFTKSFTITVNKATLAGTVTISGEAVFGETITAITSALTSSPVIPALGDLSYQWKRGTTEIGVGSPNYTLVQEDIGNPISVEITAVNCTGTKTAITDAVSKAPQAAPVAAPTMACNSATSITLNSVNNCEYNINGSAYQNSPLFSGLTPNSSYLFMQRFVETPTHLASEPSPEATFATAPLGIEDNEFDKIIVFSYQTSVYIKNESNIDLKAVEIYDMMGKMVYKSAVTHAKTTITLQVASGIYTVKLISKNNETGNKKISILN